MILVVWLLAAVCLAFIQAGVTLLVLILVEYRKDKINTWPCGACCGRGYTFNIYTRNWDIRCDVCDGKGWVNMRSDRRYLGSLFQ